MEIINETIDGSFVRLETPHSVLMLTINEYTKILLDSGLSWKETEERVKELKRK